MKIKEAEKIDIYSFGITLYYLFYGEYAYNLNEVKGKDYDKILKKIRDEKEFFPENRKISNVFKDFLEKILEKDYTKRININQALYHPWIKKGSKIVNNEKKKKKKRKFFKYRMLSY